MPHISYDTHNEALDKFVIQIIYYTGFLVSTIALIISLVVFIHFRNLRCLRNTVHCHLFLTFILRNLLWILLYSILPKLAYNENNDEIPQLVSQWFCKCVVTLFKYFLVTIFFWMLVEGLYLHTMIVCPFAAARVRLWHYAIIGWGLPFLFIFAWALQKTINDDEQCWMPNEMLGLEFIYIAPILCVLLINLLILANIVWVLVTKLRESKNLQTVQYRVAVKSTLVLLPLLGLTYLILLASPNEPVSKKTFAYVNAFLQSTQGFAVALFYCFLNGEVQSTLTSWAKNLRDDYSVQTLMTNLGCCTNSPPNGPTANSSSSRNQHKAAASSITELTRQDLELQSNARQQVTSFDDDDDDA